MTLDPYVETSRKVKDVGEKVLRPKLVPTQQKQNQSYLQNQYNIDKLMGRAWKLRQQLHRQPYQVELEAHFTINELDIMAPYIGWAFPSLLGEISR